MASDDDCYDYDYDVDGEEEEEGMEADWDGVAMEADEDEAELLEEDTPPPERPADCWVSNVATKGELLLILAWFNLDQIDQAKKNAYFCVIEKQCGPLGSAPGLCYSSQPVKFKLRLLSHML